MNERPFVLRLWLITAALAFTACQAATSPANAPTAPQSAEALPIATLIVPTPTPILFTHTPEPTPTPAVMATPWNFQGATPGADAATLNPAATPDPERNVGDVIYSDPLDGTVSRAWEQRAETITFAIGGGQLNAVMSKANVGARWVLRPDLTGGDQQTRVTARVNLCYDLDEYGLIFRGVRDNQRNDFYYVFKLSCAGQARLELVKNFEVTVLADWKTSPAIAAGAPAENTLMVWAAGAQMHFFVNEHYVFSAQDDSYLQGGWGFYLRDRTTGGESISFLNLIARAVTAP